MSAVIHSWATLHIGPIRPTSVFALIIDRRANGRDRVKEDNVAIVVQSSLLLPPALRIRIHWKMLDLSVSSFSCVARQVHS